MILTDKSLKEAGLKATVPRMRILALLEEAGDKHLSAEAIYKILLEQGTEVSLATIYRVLTQFETAGMVIRHNFASGQALFELDQGEHHDHLVCTHCGKIAEFVDPIIEQRQQQIAVQNGFAMTDHYLHIYGVCKDCR